MAHVLDAHRVRLAPDPRRSAPALFLDRDGTLIENIPYLADPNGVRLIHGAVDGLARFRDAGYSLVMVTNQAGVGRGFFTWADYEAVAARLRDLLDQSAMSLDAELVCGHSEELGLTCGWRKPNPGMLLEAARVLDLDMAGSIIVGDRLTDLEAGAAAGLSRFAHVATGHGAGDRPAVHAWGRPVCVLDDLSGLAPERFAKA